MKSKFKQALKVGLILAIAFMIIVVLKSLIFSLLDLETIIWNSIIKKAIAGFLTGGIVGTLAGLVYQRKS